MNKVRKVDFSVFYRVSHPKFETSADAVEGCKKELAVLKEEKEMSLSER